MTINIISKQVGRSRVTGPKKVLVNACKGFDLLGIQYVFNEPISKHEHNWIHDDQMAIIEASFAKKPVVVGPNTAVLPRDLPFFRKKLHEDSVYLFPCEWSKSVWDFLGFKECKKAVWPVGIDTELFGAIQRERSNKVLVYFKQREPQILEEALGILIAEGFEPVVIKYGSYGESELLEALGKCRFGVWIGCSESQGIGLQECLATGLPLIVLDSNSLFDNIPTDSKGYVGYDFPASLRSIKTTTVPYFDEQCGIVIDGTHGLAAAVCDVIDKYDALNPRNFIETELGIKKRSAELADFFEKINYKNQDLQIEFQANYRRIIKLFFYLNLFFQRWAWKWVFIKIKTRIFR